MKSGLEGRNNVMTAAAPVIAWFVSMKSGLEGRNNTVMADHGTLQSLVSMKSGLEGRNNPRVSRLACGCTGPSQ